MPAKRKLDRILARFPLRRTDIPRSEWETWLMSRAKWAISTPPPGLTLRTGPEFADALDKSTGRDLDVDLDELLSKPNKTPEQQELSSRLMPRARKYTDEAWRLLHGIKPGRKTITEETSRLLTLLDEVNEDCGQPCLPLVATLLTALGRPTTQTSLAFLRSKWRRAKAYRPRKRRS
ncbi:MAG TPA: hypothetical protein VFW94_06945 [Candidatus Acidoferrales bacterium]|nr:hypothetical protein [Candidatus Acidoferrales bacterium]